MTNEEVVQRFNSVGYANIGRAVVLHAIHEERERQDIKFPDQRDLLDGTGGERARSVAATAKAQCDDATAAKRVTWKDVLREEYAEAVAEEDPAKLRAELIQVAAVCIKWIEAIDKRKPALAVAE